MRLPKTSLIGAMFQCVSVMAKMVQSFEGERFKKLSRVALMTIICYSVAMRLLTPLLFIPFTILSGTHVAAQAVRTDHAEAELVSRVSSVAPGDSFRVALRLVPEDGWYVYWSNPGDAGLAPTLDWDLPHGFSAGDIGFISPERIEHPPFASFGYTSEVWYPLWMHVAADALPGPHTLSARAEWLICSDECIPESAALSLSVDVDETRIDESRAEEWNNVLERMPVPAPDWRWHAVYSDNTLEIRWTLGPDDGIPEGVSFFPHEQGVIENGAPQRLSVEGNQVVLTLDRDPLMLAQPALVEGVLTAADGWELPDGNTVPGIMIAAPTDFSASTGRDFRILVGTFAVLIGLVLVIVLILRAKNEERKSK